MAIAGVEMEGENWQTSVITLVIVAVCVAIGKAYLGGFNRGYDKGKEDGLARPSAETPTDEGETVAVHRISQKYTEALKSFTDLGKGVEDGERTRTPREEKTIGKKVERKAH